MAKNVRESKEYRIAKIKHLRNNPRCVICNAIKGRVVHHLNSVRYFPDEACDPNNLITLCDYRKNDCHGLFHNVFKGGTRKKTTKEDFERFLEVVNHKEKLRS